MYATISYLPLVLDKTGGELRLDQWWIWLLEACRVLMH